MILLGSSFSVFVGKSTYYYDLFVVFSLTIFCSEGKCAYIFEISTKIFISINIFEILAKILELSTEIVEISTEIFEIPTEIFRDLEDSGVPWISFSGLWRALEGSGRL